MGCSGNSCCMVAPSRATLSTCGRGHPLYSESVCPVSNRLIAACLSSTFLFSFCCFFLAPSFQFLLGYPVLCFSTTIGVSCPHPTALCTQHTRQDTTRHTRTRQDTTKRHLTSSPNLTAFMFISACFRHSALLLVSTKGWSSTAQLGNPMLE